jgi:hypothetical protein
MTCAVGFIGRSHDINVQGKYMGQALQPTASDDTPKPRRLRELDLTHSTRRHFMGQAFPA